MVKWLRVRLLTSSRERRSERQHDLPKISSASAQGCDLHLLSTPLAVCFVLSRGFFFVGFIGWRRRNACDGIFKAVPFW